MMEEGSAPDRRSRDPSYLNAYANGIQFALLAIEGRLRDLDTLDPLTLRSAIDEYHRMAMRLRARAGERENEDPTPTH